jgi:hypothetical protein
LLFASFAYGQNQPRGQQPPPPAKAGPYKVVSVTPPQTINDATFEAFRKQMNEAANALPSNVGSAGAQRAPLRYVKDASGWKIGGYIGGGDTQ